LGFIDGVNRYAYALNSPVNFLDPTGTVGEGSVQTPQPESRPIYGASPVDTTPGVTERIGTTTLDVLPVVGGLKSAGQVITGTDLVTGERVNRWEEAGGVLLGVLGIKFLTKVDDIADIGSDVVKQLRKGADGGIPKGGTYKLSDPETGRVRRTGRTNDLRRREGEHGRNPETKDLEFEIDRRTDSYPAQRGREQRIYDQHPEADLNRRRPISPKNPRLEEYLREGDEL
jgi:hypothetical protein